MAARYLHAGFIRLHRNERLLGFDGITGFNQQFDDFNFFKVTDIRDIDLNQAHGALRSALSPQEGRI